MLEANSIRRINEGEDLPFNFSREQLRALVTKGAEFDERLRESSKARDQHPMVVFEQLEILQNRLSLIDRQRLESLAVSMVKEEFAIKNELLFEAKLLHRLRPLQAGLTTPTKARILNEEVQKRRTINALVQGAAGAFQYTFLLSSPELNAIHPDLSRLSHEFMSKADEGLWQFDERNFNFSTLPPLGVFKLDFSTTPITARASATYFPLLVHELAKGVMEALSLQGLPNSAKERHDILKSADNVHYEPWDLRVGKGLWRLVNGELPRGKAERNLALATLFRVPAKEFNTIISSLLEGDPSPMQEITIIELGR